MRYAARIILNLTSKLTRQCSTSTKMGKLSRGAVQTEPYSPDSSEERAKPDELKLGNLMNQSQSVTSTLEQQCSVVEQEAFHKAVSFEDVPGPAVLRLIAKAWSYVPIMGNQVTANTMQYLLSTGSQLSYRDNMYLFKYLLDEYGPVVRLHGPFGGNVVIVSRPEHAAVVFENEGPYPVRSSLDCVEKYRLEYRHYKQAGPFVMYGPEWERVRRSMEASLRETASVHHRAKIEKAGDELIDRILFIRNRQSEMPRDFADEIHKWCLECLGSVAFNRRLGCLEVQGLSTVSEPHLLLESLKEASSAIRRCEFGLHLWRYVETPAWKKLVNSMTQIESIVQRHIRTARELVRERQERAVGEQLRDISLIECFLLRDAMLSEDVLTIMLDMLIIGVNMTSHSAAFLIYHLARNPRAQVRLHAEVTEMGADGPYMRACIRESLRLKPPMPVLSRVTTRDLSVHGYQVPRGTQILIATNLASCNEEHFEDAAYFRPERWLKDKHCEGADPDDVAGRALASIPFGRGPKACVAQELAHLQLGLLASQLLQRFRIEYHYGDICSSNRLLAAPTRPLRFRFVDR